MKPISPMFVCFKRRIRVGKEIPSGYKEIRPTNGCALFAKKIMREKEVRRFMRGQRGIVRRSWRGMVTRVSLSDWLALQARIRGSKDPRLLRDRPSDGAALVCKNFMLTFRGVQVMAEA